jgi:hypothetical protein
MLDFADDHRMKRVEVLAEEFYEKVLRPHEDAGFVSDEASLLDISLAPEEELVEDQDPLREGCNEAGFAKALLVFAGGVEC